ncbi:MAG: adenylyl-sulfate kinase [Ardenticatenaceae bacterium]|nr:adenylyl-sulfate kinase [Ardenticatenaceae bacterium]
MKRRSRLDEFRESLRLQHSYNTITPGLVIWFTGLPGSGKSTLASALRQRLAAQGIPVQVLDSDELRRQLTPHRKCSVPQET